jgi:hypothetical protein
MLDAANQVGGNRMRAGWVLAVAAVTGCAAETVDAPEAARPAAVAAHVGKPTDAVAASWSGATEAGTAMVTVSDAEAGGAERVHTCEVDAAGRVRAIRHPGA